MIVLADADIEKAAAGAVAACFPSAGQLCVSIERLYVADEIHDAFVAAFVERTRAMRLGAAYDFSADMGSLTTLPQLETVSSHVDDAVSKGATVLAGGSARPDLGRSRGCAPWASDDHVTRRPTTLSPAPAGRKISQ
ncbi:succinate-semialdehyde dehydrogenase/glutarate-semialdehyde dehydrogenase [Nocardia transvalensis]|uniref:Succinate-semialdehyde dehydrogenase/glutarate-semialdehyde dehydrogenase n=1 Tax=Nocardia transvalensis TaxID=37333 RepID=A0A7W9ULK8_9NOCA|nr:succinate-semialdehyde dehydrogenase/glutarate-semialdehyde dehydrogenase [Nocardia transvalensis]